MEENVALCSSNQKNFVKSIQGIKKIIKANKSVALDTSKKVKHGYVTKQKKKKPKGLVYLSHIPHGFYEHQMTEYFKQFGVVTNARVIRSKRTGRSKGHAFVEFKEPAVAQIVAETMNNYLMGKRLIQASYIPPEKQKVKAFRRHWNPTNNPGTNLRKKLKKAYNQNKDDKGDLKTAKHILSNLAKTKKKLRELGVNYDFFQPVDIPQALSEVKAEPQQSESDEKSISTSKPSKNHNLNVKSSPEKKIKKKEKVLNSNTTHLGYQVMSIKKENSKDSLSKNLQGEHVKPKGNSFERKKKQKPNISQVLKGTSKKRKILAKQS